MEKNARMIQRAIRLYDLTLCWSFAAAPPRLEAGGVLPKPPISVRGVGFNYPGQELLFSGAEFRCDTFVTRKTEFRSDTFVTRKTGCSSPSPSSGVTLS
eukprot:1183372-Prorocentrum_minimum.AAC.1